MIEKPEQRCIKLRLTIAYEPAQYRNEQTVWINAPFEENIFNEALNHGLSVFSAEMYSRMIYTNLVRRGIQCEFRHGRVAEVSLLREQPVRKINWLRRFIRNIFASSV